MGYIELGYNGEKEYYIPTCEDCTRFMEATDGKCYCAWSDSKVERKNEKCRQFIYNGKVI